MTNIINEHEIRILGLRRTGNHAIIHWILERQGGTAIHLNDILPRKGLDPYTTLRNRITVKKIPYWRCYRGYSLNHLKSLVKTVLRIPENFALQTKDPQVITNRLRQSKKNYFIYSYEDIYPEDERIKAFEADSKKFIGLSRERYEILILRDPYNLFASLIRSKMIGPENYKTYVDLYKAYAQEFINNNQMIRDMKRIYLNYNRWFMEPEYRIQLSKNLGFEDDGHPYMKVAAMGKGSSFDGQQLNHQAQSMAVLERWKEMQEHPLWQQAVRDPALDELSRQIFGPIVSA